MAPLPRLGLVMTVKNEARPLRQNLLYHRRAGVEHVFLFDDGSTDGGLASVADLDFVEARPSLPPEAFRDRSELRELTEGAASDHIRRQALHASQALHDARRLGLDWLLHLDADELACVEPRHAEPGALRQFLAGFPETTLQVVFETREAVQRRMVEPEFFGGTTLFKTDPKRFSRWMGDPGAGQPFRLDGFYGHAQGKSAVRVCAPALALDVHRFCGPGGAWLRTERRGLLLHYFAHDFRAFREKFAAYAGYPARYPTGAPVERQRLVWRDLVGDPALDEGALRAYYERFVLFGDEEVRRLRATRRFGFWPVEPAIVEVTAVRDALQEMGLLDTTRPGSG